MVSATQDAVFGKKDSEPFDIVRYSGEHLTIIVARRSNKDSSEMEAHEKINELLGSGWTLTSTFTESDTPNNNNNWWKQACFVLTKQN